MNFKKLQAYIDRLVTEYNVPGADCMVYKEHEPIYRYYTGMSDIESGKRMKGDELYLIFSMTKMFTCTCALQMLEQGRFLLSDPVSKYIPEFSKMKLSSEALDSAEAVKIMTGGVVGSDAKNNVSGYADTPITIKHLFTMTAGLNYDLDAPYIRNAILAGRTGTLDIVRTLSETPLGFEPGTRYRYSLCHDVLGGLVEVWSGKRLGDYMKENIFDALGMKDTFFGLPTDAERISRMAALYKYDSERRPLRIDLKCDYNVSSEYQSGGAGLTSCTEDYALFLDALANGGQGRNGNRILSSATVELMRTNHLSGQAQDDFYGLREGYGYGLGVRTHTDRSRSGSLSPLGEFGWDGAAGAFSMVDPANKLAFVYFQHVHNWELRTQLELRNALYSCIE